MIPWFIRSALLGAALGCAGSDDGTAPPPDDTSAPTTDTAADFATVQLAEQLTTVDFEGFKSYHWVPDAPVGLVFVFHGSNSTVDAVLQIEWIELYNEFIDRNIAFVMTGSTDRVGGSWDHFEADPAQNDDFPRLSNLRDHLITETAIAADTPVGSLGFSGGASMANYFGGMALDSGWDFRVFSMHNSSGYNRVIAADGLFVSAENDPTGPPDNLATHTATCSDAGNRCQHLPGVEVALHPLRFSKSKLYGRDMSEQMFDELIAMQLIDAEGWRLPSVDVSSLDAVDQVIAQYERDTDAPSPFEAGQQLRVVWATHRLSAAFKVTEADFFQDALTR